jgi:transcriptional regulator with XRE-family HTH domain
MTESYAQILGRAMKKGKPDKDGVRRKVTRRQLARGIGKSYEHIRKVLQGEPVLSEEFNAAVCKFFGLDEQEMWRIAFAEKLQKRNPRAVAPSVLAPQDNTLRKIWDELTRDQRAQLLEIAKGMHQMNRAHQDLVEASA